MTNIKQKLNFIQEAVDAYKNGKLSDVSTIYVIKIILRDPPTVEAIEWAEKVFLSKGV